MKSSIWARTNFWPLSGQFCFRLENRQVLVKKVVRDRVQSQSQSVNLYHQSQSINEYFWFPILFLILLKVILLLFYSSFSSWSKLYYCYKSNFSATIKRLVYLYVPRLSINYKTISVLIDLFVYLYAPRLFYVLTQDAHLYPPRLFVFKNLYCSTSSSLIWIIWSIIFFQEFAFAFAFALRLRNDNEIESFSF